MTALDWILSLVGLAGFVAFVSIVAIWVPQPDLIVVIAIAVALATYDFWIRPFVSKR